MHFYCHFLRKVDIYYPTVTKQSNLLDRFYCFVSKKWYANYLENTTFQSSRCKNVSKINERGIQIRSEGWVIFSEIDIVFGSIEYTGKDTLMTI